MRAPTRLRNSPRVYIHYIYEYRSNSKANKRCNEYYKEKRMELYYKKLNKKKKKGFLLRRTTRLRLPTAFHLSLRAPTLFFQNVKKHMREEEEQKKIAAYCVHGF